MKSKARVIISIILLSLVFQVSYAQENYLPGVVIKSEADTLKGYIDYRNWEKNPTKIYFKEKIEGNAVIYTPLDILEFHVQSEFYVGAIVEVETSSNKIDELDEDPDLAIKTDTTFLQTLFNGDKSLFYYKNSDAKENFYIKQNNDLYLLIYKKYIQKNNGKRNIVENRKYLRQLTVYLNDCSSIQSKLKTTGYDLKSLDKLFRDYFECTNSAVTFKKERDKVSKELGLLAGASLTSVGFKTNGLEYLVDADYEQSTNVAIGFFIDVILSRNQGKWSLNNELLFTSYTVTGLYEVFKNEDDYTKTTTELSYSYLKLNNMLRFKYPIGATYLFINGGISNGFAISETNYKKEELKFFTLERLNEGKAVETTRKYEQGYILGLGLKYNKVSLETRLEKGTGMSGLSLLNSSTTRYYFLLGYRF